MIDALNGKHACIIMSQEGLLLTLCKEGSSQFFLWVGLSVQWRHQQVAVGDEDLEDVGGRMTRVLLASTGECIGTAARIQQDGLTVSCRHVFVDDGNFLNAIGWGEKLAFVASSPHDDIVLLQGEAQYSKTAGSWLACRCCTTPYASSFVQLVPAGSSDLSGNKDLLHRSTWQAL